MATIMKRISRRFHESVTGASVSSVTVTPNDDPTEVVESATEQFTAVIKDHAGLTIPQLAGAIAWTVSDEAAGTIDTDGLYTAGTTNATYQVIATHTASGVAGEVDVSVINP